MHPWMPVNIRRCTRWGRLPSTLLVPRQQDSSQSWARPTVISRTWQLRVRSQLVACTSRICTRHCREHDEQEFRCSRRQSWTRLTIALAILGANDIRVLVIQSQRMPIQSSELLERRKEFANFTSTTLLLRVLGSTPFHTHCNMSVWLTHRHMRFI
jgi:hypothetical protein